MRGERALDPEARNLTRRRWQPCGRSFAFSPRGVSDIQIRGRIRQRTVRRELSSGWIRACLRLRARAYNVTIIINAPRYTLSRGWRSARRCVSTSDVAGRWQRAANFRARGQLPSTPDANVTPVRPGGTFSVARRRARGGRGFLASVYALAVDFFPLGYDRECV